MHIDRAVIAVDFSAASLAAARWVAMQLAPRAELALVHVVSEPAVPSFVRPHLRPREEVAAELTPALYGALRGLASVVGSERTTIELLTGSPADALAAFAREFRADLISLGRRRRRRGAARFGDTTAQRLLAQTRIPVLVVPMARPTLPTRILAAVDDQASCATDLRVAWELAQRYEAELELLHVLSPELPAMVSVGRARGSTGKARLESLTQEWLAARMRPISDRAGRVTSHVRIGDPGEQIVRFVHAAAADLVVLGRGGDRRIDDAAAGDRTALPLGSTARLVLWASPCPVLVLPPGPTTARPPRVSRARRTRARPILPRNASRPTRPTACRTTDQHHLTFHNPEISQET